MNYTLALLFSLSLGIFCHQTTYTQKQSDSIDNLLQKTNQYDKLRILIKLVKSTSDTDTSLCNRYINQGLHLADSLQSHQYMVEFRIQKGSIYPNASKGIHLMKDAVIMARETEKPNLIANALNSLGTKYFNLSDYEKALQNYLEALSLYSSQQHVSGMAQTYNNLGIIYGVYKNYEQAEKYLTKSYNLAKQIQDPDLMTESSINLGSVCLNNKSYKKALNYFNLTVELVDSINNPEYLAVAYFNIGLVYENMKQYNKARSFYRSCLSATDSGSIHPSKASALAREGIILSYLNLNKQAITTLKKALNAAKKIGFKEYQAKSYQALADIYKQEEQYKQAYYYLQMYKTINDSIYNEKSHQQIAEMQTRFELNAIQEANLYLQQQAKNQKLRSTLLIILIAVSLLAATLLIYSLRYKNISLKQRSLISEREKQVAELSLKKKAAEIQKAKEKSYRLQQEIIAQQEISRLKETQYETELFHKDRELSTSTLHMINKNATLQDIYTKLENASKGNNEQIKTTIINILHEIKNNINLDENWEKFKFHFEEVHPGFFNRLIEHYPNFTNNDLKLCAYLRINLDTKEIAQILSISLPALEKRRHRLRKKANLTPDTDLIRFMQSF